MSSEIIIIIVTFGFLIICSFFYTKNEEINKPVSSHWARHTGATLLLNAGVGEEIVAKVLGHSTTKITKRVYAKLLDETVAREMEKITL